VLATVLTGSLPGGDRLGQGDTAWQFITMFRRPVRPSFSRKAKTDGHACCLELLDGVKLSGL